MEPPAACPGGGKFLKRGFELQAGCSDQRLRPLRERVGSRVKRGGAAWT
jgi:hypothetical protein